MYITYNLLDNCIQTKTRLITKYVGIVSSHLLQLNLVD